ncbi:MAG: hypothetical protein Q9166_005932 [cf. Caloplaca sp. 2 TL-2023]
MHVPIPLPVLLTLTSLLASTAALPEAQLNHPTPTASLLQGLGPVLASSLQANEEQLSRRFAEPEAQPHTPKIHPEGLRRMSSELSAHGWHHSATATQPGGPAPELKSVVQAGGGFPVKTKDYPAVRSILSKWGWHKETPTPGAYYTEAGISPCGTYATTATDGPCGDWFTARYSITPSRPTATTEEAPEKTITMTREHTLTRPPSTMTTVSTTTAVSTRTCTNDALCWDDNRR